jgi:hypothetical protein
MPSDDDSYQAGRFHQPFDGGNWGDYNQGRIDRQAWDEEQRRLRESGWGSLPPTAAPTPWPTPVADGGGGGGGGGADAGIDVGSLGGLVKGIFLLAITPFAFCILYPLTIVATGAVGYGTFRALEFFRPQITTIKAQWVVALIFITPIMLSLVTLWTCSRLEHRLARWRLYWHPRHLWRVAACGAMVVALLLEFNGKLKASLTLGGLWQQLSRGTPQQFGLIAAAIVVGHCGLVYAGTLQEEWHEWLEFLHLRSREE